MTMREQDDELEKVREEMREMSAAAAASFFETERRAEELSNTLYVPSRQNATDTLTPSRPSLGEEAHGMVGPWLVVDQTHGSVMGDCDTRAEADALKADLDATNLGVSYAIAALSSDAAPQGGERERVRAALVAVLRASIVSAKPGTALELAAALNLNASATEFDVADALLASSGRDDAGRRE